MSKTRWWKCDLQVATPAWKFSFPEGSNYRFGTGDVALETAERIRFLDAYMEQLKINGVEVIALADHNTGDWIDDAKAAGQRHGIVVFPGCEITTNTGADGAHLLIIGDRSKTSKDFDRLIHGQLGFGHDNEPYRIQGKDKIPASSGLTAGQIFESLPDDFLAIAPHALNDNGIASPKTAKGDIRWKALHHDRLVAVDPGDCSDTTGDSFSQRFRRRDLSDFPRLPTLAFIATSDAYCIENLGKRYTWIRMAEPSIEALRQACLDHESRVLCDWSPKLKTFPGNNPNNVRHAWISSVTLGGEMSNTSKPLELQFHHGLNVLIGGRGSGKSSVVAALRQLYSSNESLPTRLKSEAEDFAQTVFGKAVLHATHRVQESQEEQLASWTLQAGRNTIAKGQTSRTTFGATVISQKELFERAAGDRNDPELTSRSLLALIDASLYTSGSFLSFNGGFGAGKAVGVETLSTADFTTALDDARAKWTTDHRAFVRFKNDLAELPSLRQRLETLEQQVQAFFSPDVTERLNVVKSRLAEGQELRARRTALVDQIETALASVEEIEVLKSEVPNHAPEFVEVAARYEKIQAALAASVIVVARGAKKELDDFEESKAYTAWSAIHDAADTEMRDYVASLTAQGLSPDEFSRLQEELNRTRYAIEQLETKAHELKKVELQSTNSWNALIDLFAKRRAGRDALLNQVATASGRLRFSSALMQDLAPWVEFVRNAAGFRADGYLDDTRHLAAWLWKGDEAECPMRLNQWQEFLVNKDTKVFQAVIGLRSAFVERFERVDESARYRMATEFPDDVVGMDFLKEHGKAEVNADWQSIVRGSPGQRTAAMLAFVLHHGREPLVLDQPEDDLDSEWISKLVVKELRQSRWHRQLIVVSHNANIPVLGDAEQVIALENRDNSLCIRESDGVDTNGQPVKLPHVGPVENVLVRKDIQSIMEGGVAAFVLREQKYNNETKSHRAY